MLETFFGVVHRWISVVVAFSAIASAVIGVRAMRRGLTYNTMAATLVVIVAFAVGRVWHTIFEMLHFEEGELFEYLIYFAGYVSFWVLAFRTAKLKKYEETLLKRG